MTAAIAVAFFLQAMFDRRISLVGGGIDLILVMASAAVPFWAFGLVGQSIAVETVPFGYASMNLVSPIWPQSSGVFAWTGIYALTRGQIGATAAQYEGYSYLGIGLLLLLVAALFKVRAFIRAIGPMLGRHTMLAAALLVLTVWAISNTVYAGPVLLVSYPLPDVLLRTVLAWFRAAGRFFWPVAWFVAACAIAGTLKLFRPSAAVMLIIAAVALQAVDLSIWRSRLAALVSNPTPSAFGSMAASAEIEAEVARRGSARVVPALLCSARPGAYASLAVVAGIELQLLAARQNAAMQSVVASRNEIDCAAERATPLRTLAGRAVVLVLAQPGAKDRRDEARQDLSCRETPPGLVCTAP